MFIIHLLIAFTVSQEGSQVHLAFDPSPDEVTGYRVYQTMEGGSVSMVRTLTTTETDFFLDIKPFAEYDWYLTAFKDELESDPSNTVTYVQPGKLEISQWQDGPNKVYQLEADVFQGMNYEIEATLSLNSGWQVVSEGFAAADRLVIPFNSNEPIMFFRLKKKAPSVSLLRSVNTIDLLSDTDEIPDLVYTPATRWQKFKYWMRYRPGKHPDNRKGAERLIEKKKEATPILMPTLPPMAPRPPFGITIRQNDE